MSSSVTDCPVAWESDEEAELELFDADLADPGGEDSDDKVEEVDSAELEDGVQLSISGEARGAARGRRRTAGTCRSRSRWTAPAWTTAASSWPGLPPLWNATCSTPTSS
jgi:hypothetical protein